ncbi:polycystin-1-like protein 2 [Branchiostoma floridae x Branchiostoma belcheri]
MPEGSTFTRSERLGCCLSLLLMSMVSSAMWLRDGIETQVVQAINLGPFSFTLNEVYIGAMTSITCLPVILAIVLLFQYSRPSSKGDSRVRDMETGDRPNATTQQRPTKGLPHWCKYVAWVLVVLSSVGSAAFTVLYGLEWGKEKSERWLSAYFTTFFVDTLFSQPVKIMLLATFFSTLRKTQALKQIFEEKPETVSQEEEAVSSRMRAGLDCVAFRKERKMERLSMMSLLNVKEARMGKDRDRRFGVVLWGIVWYCLSLLLLVIIADAQHKTTPAFHQTQSATNSFVPSLDEVKGAASFWSWLNVTALESFYPDTSYNGGHLRWREKGFTADVQSVLVSPPSLMQGRAKPGLCTVPAAVQHEFEECSSGYGEHTKETGMFWKGWERVTNTSEVEPGATGWNYHPGDSLSLPIYGVTTRYLGDGFAVQLGQSADEMRSILAELRADGWIDKRTRVIFLEVMLYNGNPDMLTSLTAVFEFSETAGVFTQHHLHTFRFHQQPGTIGYIYVLLEIVYVIILLYTLWKEVNAARAAGLAYLKDLWNVVEIFNFFLAFTVIALYGVNRAYSSKALTAIRDGEDRVLHSRSMVKMNLVYGWFLSFLTFVSMLKLLRLLRFNPFLAKLASVFRAMAEEFLVFIIYFFIILSAFGAYTYLTFGLIMKEYTTVTNSLSTLFQMSLGSFNFHELQEANPILGPIYFFGFICIQILILMNVATAIIDRALPDVRNHVMPKEDQEFIRGVWQRFTDFFGFEEVPVTGDDAMDKLYDSITEVEIKAEKLWLQRKTFFNCRVKDADLPTELEFVPAVKDDWDAAAVEIGVSKAARCRVIDHEVRPATQNNSTDGGCRAEASVAVAASSPSEGLSDSQNSHQTKQQHRAEAKAVTSPLNQPSKLTNGKVTSILAKRPESLEKRVRERRLALDIQTHRGKAETALRKVWVPGLTLTIFDRRVLTVGEMLTDDHIQAAQKLLRRQYPALQGLEEPAVGLCEDGFARITGNGLQIHNNRAQHWVLSSHTDGQVCLYDSLGAAMTTSLQIQLCQVYAAFADRERHVLSVKRPTVQRQTNTVDCGLFAIAWAVDIAEGQDVPRVVYDDEKMRSHLEMCFKQEKLTPFPRLHGYIARAGPARVERVSLVCRCAQGQGERLGRMGRCKVCRRILHVSCLPTSPAVDGTLSCGDCTV